jgi:hypothetical protein
MQECKRDTTKCAKHQTNYPGDLSSNNSCNTTEKHDTDIKDTPFGNTPWPPGSTEIHTPGTTGPHTLGSHLGHTLDKQDDKVLEHPITNQALKQSDLGTDRRLTGAEQRIVATKGFDICLQKLESDIRENFRGDFEEPCDDREIRPEDWVKNSEIDKETEKMKANCSQHWGKVTKENFLKNFNIGHMADGIAKVKIENLLFEYRHVFFSGNMEQFREGALIPPLDIELKER